MKGTVFELIMGLINDTDTRLTHTKASEAWVKQYGVMRTRRVQNLSLNLAVALLF